jgi:hypothetical protein
VNRSLLLLALALAACNDSGPDSDATVLPVKPPTAGGSKEPPRVAIDQILVSFKGAKRTYTDADKWTVVRSQADAAALAKRLVDRLEAGASFASLKEEFSDYRLFKLGFKAGGVVHVANDKVAHRQNEVPYRNLYVGWRRAAFRLKLGEVTIVDYDKKHCPEGFYILKRVG